MKLEDVEAIARAAIAGDAAALGQYFEVLRGWFAEDRAFGEHMGVEIVSIEKERVVARMPYRRALARGGGIFHGGAIMSLADHAAGCVFNTDPRVIADRSTGLTTDFAASFLRAAPPGEALVAEAAVMKRGKTVSFIDVAVRTDAGIAIAAVRTTYVTVPREKLARR